MSLLSNYTDEISALNRAVSKQRPKDVLQFCANFFNRRLETQRAEYLAASKNSYKMTSERGDSSFQGNNPFGGAPAQSSAMQQLREEDEMDAVASPTATSFQNTAMNRDTQPSSSPFNNSSSPFGSSFGNSSPFSSNSQLPSSFPSHAPTEGLPHNYAMGRRTSVSAESMNPTASASDNWSPPNNPKTPEQLNRIKAAVAANFLFSHLDEDQTDLVLGALFEKPIPAKGIKVISQGDAGDNFYIVERGTFDVHIHPSGTIQAGLEGLGHKVTSIGPGGSFGELALMYNAPRAATIISTEANSFLWALDRLTFRRILMDAAFQRRRMYESFLEEVPLLSPLTPYERSKIADALETQKFSPGSTIILEGDIGEAFYLLESGTAAVYKRNTGNRVIHTYKKGDFFGELALLDDKPRAASVVSIDEVKVATLGKEGFLRLLGPVAERMREMDPSKRRGQQSQQQEPMSPASTQGQRWGHTQGAPSFGVDPLSH